MSDENELQQMAVAELAQRCAQETDRYLHKQSHDSSYCFELFRRAIQKADQAAWDVICAQYQPLVSRWVRRHTGFQDTGEEIQYFVNGAFGKLYNTITALKFDGFSGIGSLLQYLKLCVYSLITDYIRSAEQVRLYPIEDIPDSPSPDPSVEEQEMKRTYQQAFWEWINAWLNDDKERAVVYGSFVLALKPQEVYNLFPNRFLDVDEVYRVKQNVISRLRRNPEFRKFLGEND